MRVSCTFFLLASLISTYSVFQYAHAVDNLEPAKAPMNTQIEFTTDQKKDIVKKIENEFSKNDIADYFDSDAILNILNQNMLYLSNAIKYLDFKRKDELLLHVFKLNWLTSLNISGNELRSLPERIDNLTSLKDLWLLYNQLTSLPETISNLKNLQILMLSNNTLTSLPEAITNLINLKTLSINKNELTILPEKIGKLVNLEQLNLSDNKLTTIPASIGNIATLTLLDLTNNPYLLPRSGNPLEWGKEELRTHFGDRVILDEPNLKPMKASTAKEKLYAALDKQSLRLNRDIFASTKLPDIQVDKILEGEEMLDSLIHIIADLNFYDDQKPGYLSYEMLANDFASDARDQHLSNFEKVQTYLIPRLTGYIRALYNLPLKGNDQEPWKMYKEQIPETQKALTFIMRRLEDITDPDAKMLLFNLLVNGLLHCPTGQAEGINAVAYALSEGGYQTNNFKDNLKRFLAVKKNATFTTTILAKGADNSQNVHLISHYRDLLKEELGLNTAISSYEERMGILGKDPFADNQWNVVHVFYDIASPNRLIDWVMQSAETKKDREDEKNLRDIQAQKLSPEERAKTVNSLRAQTRQNKQFRPFTTGSIAEYLYSQGLISDDENDRRWQHYFTTDPLVDDFAVLTRDGAKAILIHEGFLIEERQNDQMIVNNNNNNNIMMD